MNAAFARAMSLVETLVARAPMEWLVVAAIVWLASVLFLVYAYRRQRAILADIIEKRERRGSEPSLLSAVGRDAASREASEAQRDRGFMFGDVPSPELATPDPADSARETDAIEQGASDVRALGDELAQETSRVATIDTSAEPRASANVDREPAIRTSDEARLHNDTAEPAPLAGVFAGLRDEASVLFEARPAADAAAPLNSAMRPPHVSPELAPHARPRATPPQPTVDASHAQPQPHAANGAHERAGARSDDLPDADAPIAIHGINTLRMPRDEVADVIAAVEARVASDPVEAAALKDLLRALYLDESVFRFSALSRIDDDDRELAAALVTAWLSNAYPLERWSAAFEATQGGVAIAAENEGETIQRG